MHRKPTSFAEFKAEHLADHQTAFNRGCVAAGNALILAAAAPLLLRRWRGGAAMFLAGGTILAAGHAAEGTLGHAGRDLVQHPAWAIRADVELMAEVMGGR